MDVGTEAIFDTLYIGSRIENVVEDFSQYEIQFFSYLSCLLFLYAGNPVNDWQYSFVKADSGFPFSNDIYNAINFHIVRNSFEECDKNYFKVSEFGKIQVDFFRSLKSLKYRQKYLDAACDSISVLPIGYIKQAVHSDPVLKSASNSRSKKFLLNMDSPSIKILYHQFSCLKESLSKLNTKQLLIPAVVWIEGLYSKSKSKEKNESR